MATGLYAPPAGYCWQPKLPELPKGALLFGPEGLKVRLVLVRKDN